MLYGNRRWGRRPRTEKTQRPISPRSAPAGVLALGILVYTVFLCSSLTEQRDVLPPAGAVQAMAAEGDGTSDTEAFIPEEDSSLWSYLESLLRGLITGE